MQVMLYFGSFNPIHNGHLSIAEWVLAHDLCDEVWLVVSPQNPFKTDAELFPEADRLQMARLAAEGSEYRARIRVSDIEISLPKPSYTIDTLSALQQKHPDDTFSILMGSDNAARIDGWKDYKTLCDRYSIWVYPRSGFEEVKLRAGMRWLPEAPLLDVSATDIRKRMAAGADVTGLVPPAAALYLQTHNLL